MHTEIASILDDATIREAAAQMRLEGVRSLVVVRKHEDDAFGIITYADIVHKVLAEKRDTSQVRVYEVMTKPAVTVHPGMEVQYVARLFARFRIGHALVAEGSKLLGVVSLTDLITEVIAEPD
jgi:signal-transduction protein with cAMP-binding, CBS, and nucleotidyltransferase domain